MTIRMHIIGAPGSGCTTLGNAFAAARGFAFFDTDDFYFDVKHSVKREAERRNADLFNAIRQVENSVVSGSVDGWNSDLDPLFTHIVFLRLDNATRMQRLYQREVDRYGAEALLPGQPEHERHAFFMEWASHYEDGTREGRNLARHEAWLEKQSAPLLRLDSAAPVETLVQKVTEFVKPYAR